MTEQLPAPLTPTDCDLRGLEYMPLLGNHLFGSDFNATCTDGEWRAGVTLWWAAWNQVPAGSLPDDDASLARLADLGRDVKSWRKMRVKALRGFEKCSDGRLYSKFLAAQVLIAWEKRTKERARKAAWRANKPKQNQQSDLICPADIDGDNHGTEQGRPVFVPADGTGRDVSKKEEDDRSFESAGDARDLIVVQEPLLDLTTRLCDAAGFRAIVTPGTLVSTADIVKSWLAEGFDPDLDMLPAIRGVIQNSHDPTSSMRRFDKPIRHFNAQRKGEPHAASSRTDRYPAKPSGDGLSTAFAERLERAGIG